MESFEDQLMQKMQATLAKQRDVASILEGAMKKTNSTI
jgi:hypothetical protein